MHISSNATCFLFKPSAICLPAVMAVLSLCIFFFLSGLPCIRRCSSLQPASAVHSSPFSASSSGNQLLTSSDDQMRRQARHLRSLPLATDGTLELLERVLDAMESGLAFMERVEDELNLDAIIGSRIVEGTCRWRFE